VLGQSDTGGANVGGFVGYNSQWDDVVLGFELNYGASRYFANAPSTPISRRTAAGGNVYDVTVDGNASMHISDFGTARARFGYVMKNFMPYAMAGLAVGRADITRSVKISGEENPPNDGTACSDNPTCVPFSFSSSEIRNHAFIYGWAVGGGVDALILPNVFVRAEYEYASFASVAGIRAFVNTGRVGAGLKF
jgi:opacity protein-like surface antigen